MASELSTHIQSILADALTNISSSNPNIPSHHVRKEGWTEVYGNVALQASKNKQTQKNPNGIDIQPSDDNDNDNNNDNENDNNNDNDIQLIQYRTEWSTQLLLRIYSIPHQVHNSPYISNQATGALPQYKKLSDQIIIGNRDILPFLAKDLHGKRNGYVGNGNGNRNSLSKTQLSEQKCLDTLIHSQSLILHSLRYGDHQAWEQIYRPQCIRASTLHSISTSRSRSRGDASFMVKEDEDNGMGISRLGLKWNGFAWFQAWAERAVYLKQVKLGHVANLLNSNHGNGNTNGNGHGNSNSNGHGQAKELTLVEETIALAREGYEALDTKIELGGGTLLGTKALTLADIKLFGHLAEALCDVHLVTVLAEYKNLIAFFQDVHQKYFGKGYLRDCILEDVTNDEDLRGAAANDDNGKGMKGKFQWIKENDLVNALNQFNQLPMNATRTHGSLFRGKAKVANVNVNANGGYQDAIKIMQEVALHCHDLQEVLVDMAVQKKKDDALVAKDSIGKKGVGALMHKFLMGADLKMKKSGADDDGDNEDEDDDGDQDDIMRKNKQHMKEMMSKARKNDEIWISGVVAVTVIALLASSSGAGE